MMTSHTVVLKEADHSLGQQLSHDAPQHDVRGLLLQEKTCDFTTQYHMGSHDPLLTSSGLKDCFMCVYLRNLAMGRMLEPVYIMMKKKIPVEKMRESWGLSYGRGRGQGMMGGARGMMGGARG